MKVIFAEFFDAGVVYVLNGTDWHYPDGLKTIFCQSIDLVFYPEMGTFFLVVKIAGIGQPQRIFFGGRYFIQGEE